MATPSKQFIDELNKKKKDKQFSELSEAPPQFSTLDEAPTPKSPVKPLLTPQISTIRDMDTGKITGTTLPDGRVILGGQTDIRELMLGESKKRLTPIVEGADVAKEQNVMSQSEIKLGAEQMLTERDAERAKTEQAQAQPTAQPGKIGAGDIAAGVALAVGTVLAFSPAAPIVIPAMAAVASSYLATIAAGGALTATQGIMVKTGLGKLLTSKAAIFGVGVGTSIFSIGKLAGTPKREIASISSSLGGISTAVGQEVNFAKYSGRPEEALERIEAYYDMVIAAESEIQKRKIAGQWFSVNREITSPVEQQIENLKRKIEISRTQIAQSIVSGSVENLEELTVMFAQEVNNPIYQDGGIFG